MTAPNLMAIMGSGAALSLAGFALMGGAAGAALAYYFPQIHLSIWLLIIGGVMLVLGLTLVERGGVKTVEKVENELSMPKMVANFPWTFAIAGAVGTLFFVWLFRRQSPTVVTKTELGQSGIKTVFIPTPAPAPSPPPTPKRTTLTDVMIPLGTAAAQFATSTAMKAFGIPSPQELLMSAVKGVFGGSEDEKAKADRLRQEAHHNGYEAAMQRS